MSHKRKPWHDSRTYIVLSVACFLALSCKIPIIPLRAKALKRSVAWYIPETYCFWSWIEGNLVCEQGLRRIRKGSALRTDSRSCVVVPCGLRAAFLADVGHRDEGGRQRIVSLERKARANHVVLGPRNAANTVLQISGNVLDVSLCCFTIYGLSGVPDIKIVELLSFSGFPTIYGYI